MRASFRYILISVFLLLPVAVATAAPVTWTDWTSQTQFTEVRGSLTIAAQPDLTEVQTILPKSKRHLELLAKAEDGTLKKKQQKKLDKLQDRYDRDMTLLSLSDAEKDALGKKDMKRLKKLSNKMNLSPSSNVASLAGSSTVDVTFTGDYSFAQTDSGTNYWNPSAPYISTEVDNAPPAPDIIGLNSAGTATITFSETVEDPLVALVSWNGNTVDFGVPIEILSFGQGYWGNGTPVLNAEGTGFFGSGEVHGVIRLPGSFDSISFTHTTENWHGLTVGVSGIGAIPVPAAVWLFGSGLIALGAMARRKKAA
jgi:hypothetical protein